MFPLRLLRKRVYMAYALSTLLIGFPYFLVIYALPLRFQVVNGKSPLTAGVALLPMLGSVAIGSTIGGAASSKKNNTFPVLVVASCLMTLGTALMSTLSNTTKVEPKTYGFQVLVGMGFGLTVSTVSLGAGLEAELKDMSRLPAVSGFCIEEYADIFLAVAQGIIAQMRVLGGSIGIAASTAILGLTQHRQLAGIVSEQELTNLQASARTLTPEQLHAVRQAYSDAFNEDLRVCAIIAGVCVLVTLGTFRKSPQPVLERRRDQMIAEQRRLRELRGKSSPAKSEAVTTPT
jgi:hypothetical protein